MRLLTGADCDPEAWRWVRGAVLNGVVLKERRGGKTGTGAAAVWTGTSVDVTWSSKSSHSSTQPQCHLKVDPPQFQHFHHWDSRALKERRPLNSRFHILSLQGFFFFFTWSSPAFFSFCSSPASSCSVLLLLLVFLLFFFFCFVVVVVFLGNDTVLCTDLFLCSLTSRLEIVNSSKLTQQLL